MGKSFFIKKAKDEKDSQGKIKHKVTFIDNIKFDSKMESNYYLYLLEKKEAGEVLEIELQPKFNLQENFIIVDGVTYFGSHSDFKSLKKKHKAVIVQAINYKADFKVLYADGRVEIVDTKGVETDVFAIKKKLFQARYPNLDLKILIYYKKLWIDYSEYKKEKAKNKKAKKSK